MSLDSGAPRRRRGSESGRGRPGGARRSARAPFLLLIASLVLAAVGAWAAQRAMATHRDAVDGVLRDYAAFAVWTFGRHVEEGFAVSLQTTFAPVLRAMNSGGQLPPPGAILAARDEAAGCDCGRSFAGSFALRIAVARAEQGVDRGVEVAGDGLDARYPRYRGAVVRQLEEAALASGDRGRYSGLVPVEVNGTRSLVAFLAVGCGTDGGIEAIYGVEADPLRLTSLFREIYEGRDLLPPTLAGGEPTEALLALAVEDPEGGVLFSSGGPPKGSGPARASVGPSFGDLQVTASVVPEAAGRLVIGGLPRSRTPFLLGIFGLAILLGIVAVGQLRRANELALLRSDFVAGVSHELRTPLAQIRLFLETLRMGRFRTEAEREWSLATIDRETRRLSHLVENVLHYSRAERGVGPVRKEAVEVAAELHDIEESFRPLALTRRATVRVEAPAGLRVEMQRDSFRQVFLNLLDNAVKYGPRGQTVRVLAELRGDRVRMLVEDEGPGVPTEDRKRIWEPFQRGARVGGAAAGSGIGLSVVREIVSRYEGKATVEGAPGGGARFVVELPAAASHPAGEEPRSARDAAPSGAEADPLEVASTGVRG